MNENEFMIKSFKDAILKHEKALKTLVFPEDVQILKEQIKQEKQALEYLLSLK